MNLPNKLTVARLILAPVIFVWFYTTDIFSGMSDVVYSSVLAVLYAVMELTDLFDGIIARRHGLVTDLGKVLDPFADVIQHMTFFTLFLTKGIMPVWAFTVIFWREFFQCFMRMLLMGKGKPMAANIFGKAKTCLYAFSSVLGFSVRIASVTGFQKSWMQTVLTVVFALAACMSVISFAVYVKNVVKEGTLSSMTR